jgi:hypothetical protein
MEGCLHPTLLRLFLVVFILGSVSADAQFKREDFQRAEKAIVRLNPSEFPNLPAGIRAVLEQRGCTVPQPYDARGEKKNVITGRFKSTEEKDWAVLCSHEGHSAILVFFEGRPDEMDEIEEEPDSQYLQVTSGGGKIGYSRQIEPASPGTIRRHINRSKQNTEHDGIENAFLEKGTIIWYRSNGKWMKLSGFD